MNPEIGDVYDIPGQPCLLEILAMQPDTETNYYLVVFKINRTDHSDTTVDELSILKTTFAQGKKVEL